MQALSRWLVSGVAVLSLDALAHAQFDPHVAAGFSARPAIPLEDRDVRFEAGGAVTEVRAAIARSRTPAVAAARELALTRLRERVPGVAIDDHVLFGTPHFVRSTIAFLTPPVAGGADAGEEVVRDFLDQNRGLFEASPGELVTSRVTRDFRTQHSDVRHMTWKQQKDGVEIVGCELRANLTKSGELINVSSTLLPRPDGDFATSPVSLDERAALLLAAAEIGVGFARAPEPASEPAGAARRRSWSSEPELRASEPTTTELVYFPRTRADVRAAWLVVLPEVGAGNTYEVTVDAETGEILKRHNRLVFAYGGTEPLSFRVFTSESPAPSSPGTPVPNGLQFPLVPQDFVTVPPSEVAAWSPSHWVFDGFNETLGNNVDAHLDLNADDIPDLPRPAGSPYRTFDFTVDTTQMPTAADYRNGAVTQLFYLANRYHDKLYSLGFDEAAHNFQLTNFSGQGVGGDAVQCDAQDGSGTDNANFGTDGVDGSVGRCQMYVFSGPTPDRDGDLDSDIVWHELTHGTSLRLLDVAAFGVQAGGMGEGWSDFVALCLGSRPGDDPTGVYNVGAWTVYQLGQPSYVDNYYFGIRRFPYTTDLTKNPQTYADIDPAQQLYDPLIPRSPIIGNTADEVHNVGEVWCVTLWDARANLIASNGYAGNDIILQLVVDGLKLSPGIPNMLQERDSILQADLVANEGRNHTALWTAFARRGMGGSATSPDGSTSAGIVEAFDIPNRVLFAYPIGKLTQILPGVPTTTQVVARRLGTSVPTPGTGMFNYSVNGGSFTSIAMTQTSNNHYTVTLPPFACFDVVNWYVTVNSNVGIVSDPPGAPATTSRAIAYTGQTDVYYDNFQTDQGWYTLNLGATSGDWQRGIPVNDTSWGYAPAADGDGSGICWLTENVAGNTDVDSGAVQLTSTAFDFSSPLGRIDYEYYLFLTVPDGIDEMVVEINPTNGVGTWTPIATHDISHGEGWSHHSILAMDVQALGVPLTSQTRVRFTATDGASASIVEAAIDGFRVSTLACVPLILPYCFGDGSGTSCPCGNNGPPGSGAGCINSLGAGSTLSGAGIPSVSVDNVVLTGTGMPNATALYFQGTTKSAGGAGVVFGDGLRCAAGTIIRLGTKTNSGGSSSYPQGADLPVHVRGLVPAAGGQRYYQCWYRNSAAFCTSATYNLTNGVGIAWQP